MFVWKNDFYLQYNPCILDFIKGLFRKYRDLFTDFMIRQLLENEKQQITNYRNKLQAKM